MRHGEATRNGSSLLIRSSGCEEPRKRLSRADEGPEAPCHTPTPYVRSRPAPASGSPKKPHPRRCEVPLSLKVYEFASTGAHSSNAKNLCLYEIRNRVFSRHPMV